MNVSRVGQLARSLTAVFAFLQMVSSAASHLGSPTHIFSDQHIYQNRCLNAQIAKKPTFKWS